MGKSIYMSSGIAIVPKNGTQENALDSASDQNNEVEAHPTINIPPPAVTKPSARRRTAPANTQAVKDDVKVNLNGPLAQVVERVNALSSNTSVHSINPALHPCEELINSIGSNTDYQVLVLNPQSDNPHTPIPAPPFLSVADIRSWLRNKFGNGTYVLKVLRNGVELQGESSYMRMMIMDAVGNVSSSAVIEEDPVKAAKTRATVKKIELEELKSESEKRKIQEDEEKARKKREKEEKEADSAPANATIEALKKQLEDQNKKLEELTKQPKTSMTDELVKLAPLLTVLVPLLKPKEENTTKLILDLFAKMDEREDKREERAERRDEKREEKFERLLEKIEEGKKGGIVEEIEKFKTLAEVLGHGKDDDDDFEFDPAHPISSLIGGVIKHGFRAIKEVAKDPNARQIMGHLAARLGKTPDEFTEQDMAPINAELEALRNASQQALPPPPPEPTPMPRIVPRPIQLPPPINISSISGLKVQTNPAPVIQPVPVVEQADSSGSVPAVETTPPPVASPVQESETPITTTETTAAENKEPAISQADVEDDLRETITQTVRQMALDLDSGREVHKWWDIAFGEWPKSFIDDFCKPASSFVESKLEILKKYSDELVFNALLERLKSESNLMNFSGSLMRFMQYRNAPETSGGTE